MFRDVCIVTVQCLWLGSMPPVPITSFTTASALAMFSTDPLVNIATSTTKEKKYTN